MKNESFRIAMWLSPLHCREVNIVTIPVADNENYSRICTLMLL